MLNNDCISENEVNDILNETNSKIKESFASLYVILCKNDLDNFLDF